MLGGSLILTQLAGLRDQVAGLYMEQIPVRADSPYVGRPLGDTKARTRTRCSIVAIVRDDGVIPSPSPADVFDAATPSSPSAPARDWTSSSASSTGAESRWTTDALVLIEIGALLFGIGLLARLAARLGISPIPLILLGGLAFGEGGLLPITQGTSSSRSAPRSASSCCC